MKGIKITGKQISSCLMLLAVGIFVYVFLIVYSDFNTKAEELKKQEQEVDAQIEERKSKNKESSDMGTDMAVIKMKMNQILTQYPSEITLSDLLLLLQKFQLENEIEFQSINIGTIDVFCDTTVPKIQVDALGTTDEVMTGIKGTVDISFSGTYENVKKWLKYAAEYNLRMSMDGVTLIYDEATGIVKGSMTIYIYDIRGNGQPYHAPSIEDVEVGKKSIFGMGN